MELTEQKYLVSLHSIPGMGHRRLKLLVDYFQSCEYAWQKEKYWSEVPGLENTLLDQIKESRRSIDVDKVFESLLKAEAHVVTIDDIEYPSLLKNIFDPPYVIYYRGELPRDTDICLGMVGARRASAYGRNMAEVLARDLAEKGVVVVSGLARGIDAFSHRGALKGSGKTVAVLGSGINVIYPRENKELYHQISGSGAVISELPLGSQPLARHFPARNRIISGLSRGILVVEAAEKSGSLITVDCALEQGRDVFAVPGPITSPLSKGTHKLIRQGAKLVERAEDILEEYFELDCTAILEDNLFSFSLEERRILELLMGGGIHFDILVEASGIGASEMASLLTMWEIKGLVKQMPGKYYTIGKL